MIKHYILTIKVLWCGSGAYMAIFASAPFEIQHDKQKGIKLANMHMSLNAAILQLHHSISIYYLHKSYSS